jgi:hypothetical protein
MWNEYGTTREPSRPNGRETTGSQFTATIEIDPGRKSVELVHMVSRPLLTLVQNKSIFLYLLSLARGS